jgi:hypothetical protein
MKKNMLLNGWLALSLACFVFFACALNSAAGQGPEGGMAIGQKWKVDDGLELTFVGVRNDTRRPIGSTRKNEGDVVVLLSAKMKYQPARLYRVRLNDYMGVFPFPHATKDKKGHWLKKRYFVNLDTLSPTPVVGKKIRPRDYRLVLFAGLDGILKPL